MRYFPALSVSVLVLGLAGCGGGVQLPPVMPDQVVVFMPGSFPAEDYKALATIREEGPIDIPDKELIERAKARAAERGADALLIDSIRRTTEGQIETDLRQEQLKILMGRAVYYPAKHPELGNK